MSDLALGRKLTVVDLDDPEKPIVVQQIVSHERPMSVAVNQQVRPSWWRLPQAATQQCL